MRHLAPLFAGLFDDAAMFPPADAKLPDALNAHVRHRLAWYADTVGPLVCNARRLPELAAAVGRLGVGPLEVVAVVPEGVADAVPLVRQAQGVPELRVAGVEARLKQLTVAQACALLAPLHADGIACYVEIPVPDVTDHHVHELGDHGIRLKLRTGGTRIDAFHTERQLAVPLVRCAAERLQFKCTAGLHNAVRHFDPQTKFEHHGFLNVALAARTAATTASVDATAEVLAERDAVEIGARVRELGGPDVAAIRAMFCSFGTCSIDEPVSDLVAMGLVRRP